MHTIISPCQYYEQINQNILYINLFLIGLNLFITQLDHLINSFFVGNYRFQFIRLYMQLTFVDIQT